MKISGGNHLPAKNPALLSSKALIASPDSSRQDRRSDHKSHRRKNKSLGFSGGIRLRSDGAPSGKRSGPATPLLRWKFDEADVSVSTYKGPEPGRKCSRKLKNGGAVPASARKLAAGLWRLQLPEMPGGGEDGALRKRSTDRLGFKPGVGHVGFPFLCHHNGRKCATEAKHQLECPLSGSGTSNGILYKVEPSFPFPCSAKEGATKWDPGCSRASDEFYGFYGRKNLCEDQEVTTFSAVSTLRAELEQAQRHIHELETECKSSKKKLDHFLRKLNEERTLWRSREHEKIRAIIDDVKADLSRERKNRQRMEIVNSKLVNELAEAKLSAKRFMQDYEKERQARELMEEVCDELAKEIGNDKAEVEALKRDSMSIREEVEEERKMLQMAEVWREERIQMKLVDAKLMLEEKYSLMNKLITDLEAFLRCRNVSTEIAEIREAELLRQAASSVNIQEIREISYVPPNSEENFPAFEDHQPTETKERTIEPSMDYSPACRSSKICTVSPDVNGFKKYPIQGYSNGFIYQNGEIEEDGSAWETVSHAEDQGSSYSPEESDPSVNRIHRDSNVSGSGTESEEDAGQHTPKTEVSEVCSVSARQLKKKASSISRLWKSNNGESCKIIMVEGMNGRLSNGRNSSAGILSPDQGSGDGGLGLPGLVGQWSSPESGNPHINRGIKGCIEWPRGIQKTSLKAKLLEARVESQKIQLRQALKQKI